MSTAIVSNDLSGNFGDKRKSPSVAPRIASMDQLRGYAIFGMILVNYLGEFDAMPWTFKHHREGGMSYADTIAPLFMFVVGMGFRLSYLRRVAQLGLAHARWGAAKRYFTLTGVGIVFYGTEFKEHGWYQIDWWDALVDIGLAGLLALPFMERSVRVRLGAAAVYLGLYQVIYSLAGYGAWVVPHSIDGGPLGPFSWVFTLLLGTVAHDLLSTRDHARIVREGLLYGVGFSVAGWLLKIPWPGVKAEWPFSQYGMTAPYALYPVGLCFLTFLLFYWVCDVRGFRFPQLSVLGENALVIYIVHNVIISSNERLVPHDASVVFALLGFVFVYACSYAVAWRLHKDHVIIKL